MSLIEVDAASLSKMLQADGLPGIFLVNRPLRDISDEVLQHLTRAHTPLYVRHGELVRIQRKEDDTPFIEPLSETAFKGMLARAMNWVKVSKQGPMHVAPPDVVVKDILALGHWPFPALDTIVEFPVFRPDGTLIHSPGYDAATRLYYAPSPQLRLPPIAEEPTLDDVINALALLEEVIGEFPYENEASHDNALGLLLTPIIRQSIHGHVPLALIDATRPGTGKSLLAETVAMIATGRKASMMTAPYDDDEWRKRIASTLAEGATIIVIDNLKGKLQSASLDSALTSYEVKERILGMSKNGVYAQRATWIATGNNIQVGGDMPRRSYWIRMDAKKDKPWTRGGFKYNLEEWVPEHRGEIIAALLTIARAWFAAGKPPAQVPRLGSFQPWADTIGGILAHTQFVEHFLGNLDQLYEQADDETMQWAAFLHAWHDFYGEQEVLTATIAKDVKAGAQEIPMVAVDLYNALPDDLIDIHKGDFKRRLGKALSHRVGSQFDDSGLHLVKSSVDRHSGAIYWRVAGMQVSQVSMPQKEEFFPSESPSTGLGTGMEGNIPAENFLEGEENKPAIPANLQDEDAFTMVDGDGNPIDWQAINRLIEDSEELINRIRPPEPAHITRLRHAKRVWTPAGTARLFQVEPFRVGVQVESSSTGRILWFDKPEEIARIAPID